MGTGIGRGLRVVLAGSLLFGGAVATGLISGVPPVSAAVRSSGSAPRSAHPTACSAAVLSRKILGVVWAQPRVGRVGAPAGCVPAGSSSAAGFAYDGGTPPLINHGGPVMGTATTTGENTVHAVFWAPAGYSFPSGYATLVDGFLANVAADSGKPTNVYATDTQYSGVRYLVHSGGAINVSAPFPTTGTCAPDTANGEGFTACVSDSALQSEVANLISASSLPTGLGQLYMVFFPPHVEGCFSATNAGSGGTCSDTYYSGYCAYHSSYGSGTPVIYSSQPYPTSFSYTCLTGQSPNGNQYADSQLDFISHEQNESITDPTGAAWWDSLGYEIGDECNFTFGNPLGGVTGSEYNQVIGTGRYYIQQEFSNEDYALKPTAGCISNEETPTASFSIGTTAPVVGLPVSFDGTPSADPDLTSGIAAYSWNFGDGSTPGAGSSPSHTYAIGGTYSVDLTVTDVDGWSGSTTRQVAVLGGEFLITTSSLPPATPGTVYGPVTLQTANQGVSSSPYVTTLKWKKVTLPKGLKLSRDGVLSGTLNAKSVPGPSSATVQVTETVTTLNGSKKVKTKTTAQATIPLTVN